MAFDIESRVEVYAPGGQQLLLKTGDMTVALLSRVFKIKPETLYLEEDVTNHAEFPTNGSFNLGALPTKYKVCGEPAVTVVEQPRLDTSDPRPRFMRSSPTDWGQQSRPWQSSSRVDSQPGPSSSSGLALLKKKPKYENQLKRTIPFVSLCADQTGKKMSIDTIIANLYVKIPESEVSVNSILCDVAPKLDCPVEDLTILDSTLVPLPDEDRDIEYWRAPSRRSYITKLPEYQELGNVIKRKKLSLGRKRGRSEYSEVSPDEQSSHFLQLDRIENSMKKVADMEVVKSTSERLLKLIELLDCKICKQISQNPVLVLCCNQVFGCQECFDQTMQHNSSCSLCRTASPQCVPIKGYEPLFDFLRAVD